MSCNSKSKSKPRFVFFWQARQIWLKCQVTGDGEEKRVGQAYDEGSSWLCVDFSLSFEFLGNKEWPGLVHSKGKELALVYMVLIGVMMA